MPEYVMQGTPLPGRADLLRRSAHALLWNLAGGAGKALAQLFIQIILARLLGPAVFGQYAAVLIVLGLGWLMADAGFGSALIQKQAISDHDVGLALGWVLCIASLMAGLIFATAPWLAHQFGDAGLLPLFRVVGLLVIVQGISNIGTSLLKRELEMKRLQVMQLLAYLAGFGLCAIPLAIAGAGAWSLVIAFGVQSGIVCIASLVLTRHTLRPRLSGDPAMQRFGLKVVMTNIANWVIENLDRFIVGKLWGVVSLGFYSVAANLSRAPIGLLVGSVQSVVLSSASRLQDAPGQLARSYLAGISALSLIVMPAFALLAIDAASVMQLIYGSAWSEASPLLAAFAVAMPLHALVAVTGPVLWARAAVERELYSQIVVALVLMAGFFLLRSFPLAYAVWLLPFAYLLRFLFLFHGLQQVLPIRWRELGIALAGPLLLSLIGVLSCLALQQALTSMTGWHFLPLGMAGLLMLLLLRGMGRHFLAADLRQLLLEQSHDARFVSLICRALRLRKDGT